MSNLKLILLLSVVGMFNFRSVSSQGFQYLGCYKDKDPRDLRRAMAYNPSMTVEICKKFCGNGNYRFAGLQSSNRCLCGDSYGKYGKLDDSQCNLTCGGDANQNCGGTWKNSIYRSSIYMGCYSYQSAETFLQIMFVTPSMTIEKCRTYCGNKNYNYASIQSSTWCVCQNNYGPQYQVEDSECNSACGGNAKQTCGGPSTNVLYRSSVYLGCYQDKAGVRDMDDDQQLKSPMTISKCRSYCGNENYNYAGLQSSSGCFCGNSFGKYGQINDTRCNLPCDGDKEQICGGRSINSMYISANIPWRTWP